MLHTPRKLEVWQVRCSPALPLSQESLRTERGHSEPCEDQGRDFSRFHINQDIAFYHIWRQEAR